MDYINLLGLIYLCYRNGVKAKLKEKNPVLWGVLTGAAMICGLIIGTAGELLFFCPDVMRVAKPATDPAYSTLVTQKWMQTLTNNPLIGLVILLFGLGGYLLVRYILDMTPDKKEPDVHWMDKINDPMG